MNLPTLNDPRFVVSVENDGGLPLLTVTFTRENAPPLYACWKFVTAKPSNDDIGSVVAERVAALLEAAAQDESTLS